MTIKTVSIDFENDSVILDKGVRLDIGTIKQVIFDRENQIGKVVVENGNVIDFDISLKSAYALIIFLGTQSWVNL